METQPINTPRPGVFKLWVLPVGERAYCTNGVEYDDPVECYNRGVGLIAGWTGWTKARVGTPDDDPTRLEGGRYDGIPTSLECSAAWAAYDATRDQPSPDEGDQFSGKAHAV